MFTLNENVELTAEILGGFIAEHELEKIKYAKLQNQYMSKPPIMELEEKENYKPDNRLVANFGRYLVLNFNGYFIGVPTKVSHPDDEVNNQVQTFWKMNDMDTVLDELGRLTSLYGRSYLFMYQNENSETEVAYNDPYDMFVIYSDKIKPKSIYGIRYEKTEDGYEGEIYGTDQWWEFLLVDGELIMVEPDVENDGRLFYGRVPIIEFVQNEERQSLIEPVETLINGYNKALSEKANDIDYFADAYLAIIGAEVDEKGIMNIRDKRLINMFNKGSGGTAKDILIEFLEKPNADESQENLLDRLERLIYNLGMVVNTSDDELKGAGVASGEALKVKQQAMHNLAMSKQRKFQAALQTMFKMFFNLITNVSPTMQDEYINIEYTWTLNTPKNKTEEVEIVKGLEGVTSREYQLSQLSDLDVEAELERIKKEEAETIATYDYEKTETFEAVE